MIFAEPVPAPSPLRAAIAAHHRADETACVQALLGRVALGPEAKERIAAQARALVEGVRRERVGKGGLDAFLHEYGLSTQEGVALMCIAEALLRVPDADTQDRLIRDKLTAADWDRHLGASESLFVNASTWALMLTGRVVRMSDFEGRTVGAVLGRLVARVGEPVIREAVLQAMRIMGRQFVMGRTIDEALDRARTLEAKGYRYSYDMLGEAARTMGDADRYMDAYRRAIAAIGRAAAGRGIVAGPGISVKLSALHPRYELAQADRVMNELAPRLLALCQDAKAQDIGLNVDAEEADRLDLSLDVIGAVSADPTLAGWNGLGVVVQAYQKRAPFVLDFLADMARRHGRRLMLRLVKGAYWDSEIKKSQERGLAGYPVFTRKVSTDLSYLACARRLLAEPAVFYPQFATHNAHTVAAVLEMAGGSRDLEFQRLHGMGESLYEQIVGTDGEGVACRIYAPVGQHEDLLAYLVRRLLENGANSSFVNRIQDERLPIEEIIADPVAAVQGLAYVPHPRIPLPVDLYGRERRNAMGVDLAARSVLVPLAAAMTAAAAKPRVARPIIGGAAGNAAGRPVYAPADRRIVVGEVVEAGPDEVERALALAAAAAPGWDLVPAADRAACLERAADLMEARIAELMAVIVREAGKTLPDAVAEVREAVDFCRYYALRARQECGRRLPLRVAMDGSRHLELRGRGVVVCISPWNFPLAIFTGQVAAGLAAGNAVIAKPAEQTPLIAAMAVALLHEAGVPGDVLHLLPGDGATVGAPLVADPRVGGVCFTGSTEVAQLINRTLAKRAERIVPLIAETGGQNALIVDSTALPEQVVNDAIVSAFQSAGQRCSALRVLLVQEDVADKVIDMLAGAMDELVVSDPALLSTDVGPVIDEEAQAMLAAHRKRMMGEARLIRQVKPGPRTAYGTFVGPAAFEIDSLGRLQREVFGPILHVLRYPAARLDDVIDAITATGYGLTMGIHSRIDATVRHIWRRARVGNTYVNRNQIGAVVGVQPFGGEGLSGTGPKAGGPHYLHRLSAERPEAGPAPVGGSLPPVGDAAGAARRAAQATLERLHAGQAAWAARPVAARAAILDAAADRLGAEAAAHLRCYAAQASSELAQPLPLPGPTGERNELSLHPRGLFLCLAVQGAPPAAALGQVAAALVAGNAVLVAGEGDMSAFRAAGVPDDALAVADGDLGTALAVLVPDARVAGVALAGPPEAAAVVQRILAARDGPIVPLVLWDGGVSGEPLPGGPHYLHRFLTERTLTIDTTAAGGNATLLSLEETASG